MSLENTRGKRKYPYLWAVIYGVLWTGYAVFTLLDAFVIPRDLVYYPKEEQGEQNQREENQKEEDIREQDIREEVQGEDWEEDNQEQILVTDTSYESSNISITISTMRQYNTQIYAAEVVIADISYLRAGLASGAFGRNLGETTSAMAEANHAILAINGDYYGFRDKGFVMRNGYLYREQARSGFGNESLVVYEDGSFEIVQESESDAEELAENGAVQIFSFGPGLIWNNEITVEADTEVEQAMRSNPRTAIGIVEPLHYILLVSDGRTKESEGLTLMELAEVMQGLGCECAYNLDGGGSSTMWFMGKVVNVPTSGRRIGERSVSDIVYIGEGAN